MTTPTTLGIQGVEARRAARDAQESPALAAELLAQASTLAGIGLTSSETLGVERVRARELPLLLAWQGPRRRSQSVSRDRTMVTRIR